MQTVSVDSRIGRLVITPQVISTAGQRVAITLVPAEHEVGWADPGWIDQWIDDGWQQIGGFVTGPHTSYHLGIQHEHGSGVHLGDDPFREWIWTMDLPLTSVDSPTTVKVDLQLAVGLYRLHYGPLAGILGIVEHDTPDPWADDAPRSDVIFTAGFSHYHPSRQRRLAIGVRKRVRESRLRRRYVRGPRRSGQHAAIWTWTGRDWVHLLDAPIEASDAIEKDLPPLPSDDDDATVVLPPLPNGLYQVRCTYEAVGELADSFMITSSGR